MSDLHSFDTTMKDVYPLPGTRIKQWVVDMRREDEWERETCPRLAVPNHYDECDDIEAASGALRVCTGSGSTQWRALALRDCRFCEGYYHGASRLPEVVAWLAAKAARPPVCADRSKLSDEIAEDIASLRDNPMFSFIKGRK